jgi:hypothetical protein
MVIRRLLFGAGVGAAALGGVLLACNAVLGIGSASPEPDAGGEAGAAPATELAKFKQDPCATYCAVVEKNCSGPYLEYLGRDPSNPGDVCMTLCQQIPVGDYQPFPGQEPAPGQDTLGCRLWHAHKVLEDGGGGPALHCRHAGPLGSEACCSIPDGAIGCAPIPCTPFCRLDLATCGGDRPGAVYGNLQGYCESVCSTDAGFPYVAGDQSISVGAGISVDGGTSFDLVDENGRPWESGDTLNCRLWHLEKALATGDLTFHCPHTDQDGGGACIGAHP